MSVRPKVLHFGWIRRAWVSTRCRGALRRTIGRPLPVITDNPEEVTCAACLKLIGRDKCSRT